MNEHYLINCFPRCCSSQVDAGAVDDPTTDICVPATHLETPTIGTDCEEVHELSVAQSRRLRHQAMTIFTWLCKRTHQLTMMIKHFDQNQDDALRDFYKVNPALTTESLVTSTCQVANIGAKTFYTWRKEFIKNDGKFARSTRGLAQFGWLLVNEDKKVELTRWIKSQKEIDVGSSLEFINDKLLSEFPVGRVREYGRLQRPVAPSTAHRWMLYCGCKYVPVTQSYLTESHQRHSTVLYRTWFCDLNYFLSLRMYRWCCFSKRALTKLKAHFKADWPHDSLGHKIPVEDVGKFPPGWFL